MCEPVVLCLCMRADNVSQSLLSVMALMRCLYILSGAYPHVRSKKVKVGGPANDVDKFCHFLQGGMGMIAMKRILIE